MSLLLVYICWCLPSVDCWHHVAFIGVQMLVFTLSTVSDSCQLYWCTDIGAYQRSLMASYVGAYLVYSAGFMPLSLVYRCWCLPLVQCQIHVNCIGVQMLVSTQCTVPASCRFYWCTYVGVYPVLIVGIMSLLLVYICWCLPSVDCWHHVAFIGVHMLVFTQC